MSVGFVQGGLMAAEIAGAAERFGPSGCAGCSGDHDTDIDTCLSVCGSAAHGLLPGEPEDLPRAAGGLGRDPARSKMQEQCVRKPSSSRSTFT